MNEREREIRGEIRGLEPPRSETPKGIRTTEPRVYVTATTTVESDKESRKAKGKAALMTAAAVVLLATLITLGSTLHLAGKTKHDGMEHGGWGKTKEALFGKPYEHYWDDLGKPGMLERAKLMIVGRHEALQGLRDSLGVESGRPIGSEDRKRLEELLKLDHYSHSPGFWNHLKEKVAEVEGDLSKVKNKVKDKTHHAAHHVDHAAHHAADTAHHAAHHAADTLATLKEALDENGLEKLKELLGMKEPSLWEKTKEKATKILGTHDDKPHHHESIVEKVKDAVGLNSDTRLLKEAMHRAEQTEDLINRVYEKRKQET